MKTKEELIIKWEKEITVLDNTITVANETNNKPWANDLVLQRNVISSLLKDIKLLK